MWLAVVTTAGVLVACGGGAGDKGSANTGGPSGASSSAGGKAQTVSLVMKDNVFEPKEITVEQGTVTFEVKNTGAAIHNVHIMSSSAEGKDFMSKPIIEGGASDKFTATFTKGGTLKFQCDFHLPDMVGTITVK